MGSYQSKEDEVLKMSTSVFVANFSDSFGAKDLWNTYKQYGMPIFLIEDRKQRQSSLHNIDGVKRGSQNSKMDSDSSPVMVLDDSCLNEKYYSLRLMGKVKDFATLANLKVVIANEGFDNIKFNYMGGYWIQLASSNFNTDGRVTRVEIEDFPNQKGKEDSVGQGNVQSEDPFNIYELLNHKRPIIDKNSNSKESLKYPPGYTPTGSYFKKSEVPKSGGSILQLIDDLVKVGETIRYNMKGCMKNMEEIIKLQGANEGGILCVWDPNMFKKTNSIVSDYFVMVRGDWMPNGKKLLIISVYAPQELSKKKMLWDYLSLVMSKWEGEVVIMGDFNEVRNNSKMFGTLFNRHGTDVFNRFICNAGLEEVPLEGCSFTWCHRSATKMSKLDRFLISDSLLCSCPNISSITLKRYLSDHRPILMREVYYDYGLDAPIIESNALVRMMKKPKYLKEKIRMWNKLNKEKSHKSKRSLLAELADCDAIIDKGEGENNVVNRRMEVVNLLQEVKKKNSLEAAQKAKINIRGILVEGTWIDSPSLVKNAVTYFFHQGSFHKGGNSSVIILIPKTPKANMVKDYMLISLIGSMYKIISKILANRLVVALGGLVNEIQSDFVADKQILDGPFILNELVQWYKKKKKQSLVFKVDFEKAYDSVRWDHLDDIIRNFGFGEKWCMWIQSCLRFYKGLKQGDPLYSFLFILVMKSLHISFQRVVDVDLFKGIELAHSLNLSHMFYVDDAIFMGRWSESNIDTIVKVLDCFNRASGLRINMTKSKLLGISVEDDKVKQAAAKIGCNTLKTYFSYLRSKVGGCMSRIQSWMK
nr:RNA-directed DNA polymerase, eukaryota, reverse transcriptase zinc-binding domain protein [Tanacetum cinerariifolium]